MLLLVEIPCQTIREAQHLEHGVLHNGVQLQILVFSSLFMDYQWFHYNVMVVSIVDIRKDPC